jgi:hypothetical protein
MGGAAGPELQLGIGEREMTHTLEGKPAVRRSLERCVAALPGGSASTATSVSGTAVGGHRGEAATP